MKKADTSKQSKIVCHYPWTSLYISPNGDVKHCCNTNLNKLGNISKQSIEEVWNGKLFQIVRNKIANGDFSGAHCNPDCQGLRDGKGYPWPEKSKASEKIVANELKGKLNFEKNNTIVDHLPLYLQLEFSNNCNFRCIMCYYEFLPPYEYIPENAVNRLLDIANTASTVSLMGGEVFMNKRDLEFIESFTPEFGTWMGFITNASYLNDAMIDRIRKFKHMWMQISIDGSTKEVFEKIRKRGNWEVVDKNIKRIIKVSNELKNFNQVWNIKLVFAVMRSNILNIAHSIEYAANLGIQICFWPVRGFHLFEENIFIYKRALRKCGDWKKSLENAFQTLEKYKSSYNYYNQVREELKTIEIQLQKPKLNIFPVAIWLLRRIVPGRHSKAQGLSKHDRHIGHLIEVYYNLRAGNTSLKSTILYLIFKGFRRFTM